MRLEFNKQGTIKKYIVQGKIENYQKDPSLASVLKKIIDGGSVAALGDIGVFGAGLKESFESEKLTIDGRVTDKGRAIAETGYNWKGLSGRFLLEVLNLDGKLYLLDCTEYSGQDTSLFEDNSGILQLGDEYRVGGNRGFRSIVLDPFKQTEQGDKSVSIKLVYDFGKDNTTYSIEGTGIVFEDNDSFYHMEQDEAYGILSEVAEHYGFETSQADVYLRDYNKSNPLLKETISSLFDMRGAFSFSNDEYVVKDARLIVEESQVADELIYEYLSRAASRQYLGYSEVAALISEFYGFFKYCEYITKNTNGVYSEMLERTSQENPKAYLRLQACRDIVPDIASSAFRLGVKDLTNRNCTIDEIAQTIVGRSKGIASVTMITKYAFKNASISRAAALLSDALKQRYNVELTVITAKDAVGYQTDVARVFYDKLKTNKNVTFIERSIGDISQIHDRYYRIEHEDGKVEWVVMTGELDAIKFENDFADSRNARMDITHTTQGFIKEMRIISVGEDGIPDSVKTEMAEV